MAEIAGLDHALVGVADLLAARSAWQRLGFTLSPRGRHIGWGTANYCIMFERDYIELLGILDPDQFTNNLDRFLERRGEGLLGLAFASADVAAAARSLARRGLAVEEPRDLKRLLELPEGTLEPAFKLAHLPPETTPGLSAFLCQHLTRKVVWQSAWTRHANAARAISAASLVVERPPALEPAYRALLPAARLERKGDSLVFQLGGFRLELVTTGDLRQDFATLPSIAPPWLAALEIATSDLAAARTCAKDAGISPLETADGRLLLPPEAANGVLLAFRGP